jgi:aminoglycoside phosphotransferase
MIPLPTFASREEQRARLGDVDFWWPYVAEILRRHDLIDVRSAPVAGHNPTYPTFLYGEIVVKLFGSAPGWRQSYRAELAAYTALARDPEIVAPRLLGSGRLYEDGEATWPYLITSKVRGIALWRAELSPEQERSVAAELGRQVRRLHGLPTDGVASDAEWPDLDVAAALARSSLPPHLIAQADAYLARHGLPSSPGLAAPPESPDRVVTNGDLVATHAYVEEGRLVGIIDWGDTVVTDRHYELIQIYRDLLHCDKALFRAFLDGYGWPGGEDFPHRAFGWALIRQTVGLAEHGSIDVFMPIAATYELLEIATLDELAATLFVL